MCLKAQPRLVLVGDNSSNPTVSAVLCPLISKKPNKKDLILSGFITAVCHSVLVLCLGA